jgi:hypothetical protein
MSRAGAAVGGSLGVVAGSIAGYYGGRALRRTRFGFDLQLAELVGAGVGAAVGAAMGAGPSEPQQLRTGVGEPASLGWP